MNKGGESATAHYLLWQVFIMDFGEEGKGSVAYSKAI